MQTDSGYRVAYWCNSFANCAVALNSLAWSKIFSLQNPKLQTLTYLNFNQARAVNLVEPNRTPTENQPNSNRTRTLTMTEPNRTRTFIVGFDSHLCLVSDIIFVVTLSRVPCNVDNLCSSLRCRRPTLLCGWQGRRHGFETGGGGKFCKQSEQKIFLTLPLFGQWGDKILLR